MKSTVDNEVRAEALISTHGWRATKTGRVSDQTAEAVIRRPVMGFRVQEEGSGRDAKDAKEDGRRERERACERFGFGWRDDLRVVRTKSLSENLW
jgi:hypothetical protein